MQPFAFPDVHSGTPAPPMARLSHFAPLTGLVLLLAAGCASRRPTDELASAVSQGEHPVAMRGEARFFDSQVKATITVSRGIGRGMGGGKGGPGGEGRRRPGGLQELPDVAHMDDDDRTAYLREKIAVGSPLPPVSMHLKLENLGSQVLTIEIADFNSDLGDFAVHPDTIAIAPAQVAEPDPMISQLGVTSDLIPVTVTLKSNGRKETEVIQVKNIMTPAGETP